MINEWVEFCAYTGTVSYTASKKIDTTWLGRFTFATILEFEGMSRILTVLARGYLFHGKDGAVISGDPHDRVDHARRALCAWCSVPEDGKRVQGKEWQFQTDFSELHTEFPELVDADGVGWFLRHVLRAADFMLTHPEKVRSTSLKYAEVIQSKFAAAWRSKVMQYQIPIFASQTKGAWTLRFDDVLADALELGPLRREGPELPPELALPMLQFLKTRNVVRGVYIDGLGHMSLSDYEEIDDVAATPATSALMRRSYQTDEDLDAVTAQHDSVQKIIAFFRNPDDKQATIHEITARFPGYAVSSSLGNNIEINAQNATKGSALCFLCEKIGVPIGQCMAFGDGTNDYSMLRAAGFGVAMGNASEEVQSCADAVTETNEEDGVARMIERVLGL